MYVCCDCYIELILLVCVCVMIQDILVGLYFLFVLIFRLELSLPHSQHCGWFVCIVWSVVLIRNDAQTHGVQPSYSTAKLSGLRASRIIQSTCSDTVHRRVGSGSRLSNFMRIRRQTDTAYAFRFCSVWVPAKKVKR